MVYPGLAAKVLFRTVPLNRSAFFSQPPSGNGASTGHVDKQKKMTRSDDAEMDRGEMSRDWSWEIRCVVRGRRRRDFHPVALPKRTK